MCVCVCECRSSHLVQAGVCCVSVCVCLHVALKQVRAERVFVTPVQQAVVLCVVHHVCYNLEESKLSAALEGFSKLPLPHSDVERIVEVE